MSLETRRDPQESAALVERLWGEVWGACNPDAIDHFVTDDFVFTTAGVDAAGAEDFKAWVAAFQSTIADLKWETMETFSTIDGSSVASRFRITGWNNGMFGLPADGKPVAFRGNALPAGTGSSGVRGSSTDS